MRRLLFVAMMMAMSLCAKAQQQQLFHAYMVCNTYEWRGDTICVAEVFIDNNKKTKLSSVKKSSIDALNFMGSLGWEPYHVMQSSKSTTHLDTTEAFYLRKRARNNAEAYKGIK